MSKLRTAVLLRASGIIAARRCDHGFRMLLAGLILAWALIWLLATNQLQLQAEADTGTAKPMTAHTDAAPAPAHAATAWWPCYDAPATPAGYNTQSS